MIWGIKETYQEKGFFHPAGLSPDFFYCFRPSVSQGGRMEAVIERPCQVE